MTAPLIFWTIFTVTAIAISAVTAGVAISKQRKRRAEESPGTDER